MSYNISDLDGTVIAPDSTYPAGDVKNTPSGTRVNRKMMGDVMQYHHRMMARAGYSPNGTPDNTTNGYQFVAAVIQQINTESAALADIAGANGFVAVRAMGLVPTVVGPTLTVTTGWLYYNAKFCYYAGGSLSATGSTLATITVVEGLPTVVLTSVGGSITPDATHFDFNDIVDHPIITQGFRLTTAEAGIVVLTNKIAIAPWTTLPSIGAGWVAFNSPQYTSDGNSRVTVGGSIESTSTTPAAVFATLPVGYWPTQNRYFPCTLIDAGGVEHTVSVGVSTDGTMRIFSTANRPTAATWVLYLDAITYLTI